MTDEEKAEEYINKNPSAKILCPFEEGRIRRVKDALLYGLAEGRKEKWHDLRKNPDDLPKECENVLCLCGIGARYYSVGHLIKTDNALSWWLNIGSKRLCNVIAWCELPKFEE